MVGIQLLSNLSECMLINKEKFRDQNFFDENFFLYLENTDLCLRAKKRDQNIFVIKNSFITHLGAASITSKNLEYLRNWHWMWSKFYFNKKHYGFFVAIKNIFLNFVSALIKYFFYLILFKNKKRKIYEMRIKGIINALIGKKSWFRL